VRKTFSEVYFTLFNLFIQKQGKDMLLIFFINEMTAHILYFPNVWYS